MALAGCALVQTPFFTIVPPCILKLTRFLAYPLQFLLQVNYSILQRLDHLLQTLQAFFKAVTLFYFWFRFGRAPFVPKSGTDPVCAMIYDKFPSRFQRHTVPRQNLFFALCRRMRLAAAAAAARFAATFLPHI